jgi:hypothetical protein
MFTAKDKDDVGLVELEEVMMGLDLSATPDSTGFRPSAITIRMSSNPTSNYSFSNSVTPEGLPRGLSIALVDFTAGEHGFEIISTPKAKPASNLDPKPAVRAQRSDDSLFETAPRMLRVPAYEEAKGSGFKRKRSIRALAQTHATASVFAPKAQIRRAEGQLDVHFNKSLG